MLSTRRRHDDTDGHKNRPCVPSPCGFTTPSRRERGTDRSDGMTQTQNTYRSDPAASCHTHTITHTFIMRPHGNRNGAGARPRTWRKVWKMHPNPCFTVAYCIHSGIHTLYGVYICIMYALCMLSMRCGNILKWERACTFAYRVRILLVMHILRMRLSACVTRVVFVLVGGV